ncbi:hypothetical protein [Streptomyces sp. NRRL S-1022]|uniref:hypothetical protein n=1 Tax=Streptomyces sp. NRRL S-1022 TaxID=1463880 RepID=UPI00131EA5C8|nr:hypothetical protein [Streptomyces sp. NRRL S-1022]
MPIRRLAATAVVAVAATVVVTAPAEAATKSTATITSSSLSTSVGGTVNLRGHIYPSIGRAYEWQELVSGHWVKVASGKTNSHGDAYFSQKNTIAGRHSARLFALKTSKYASATSRPVSWTAYAKTTATARLSAPTVELAAPATLTVTLSPAAVRPVTLQRYSGGAWKTLVNATTSSGGKHAFSLDTSSRGTTSYRVVAPAAGYARAATSATVKQTVTGPFTAPYVFGVDTANAARIVAYSPSGGATRTLYTASGYGTTIKAHAAGPDGTTLWSEQRQDYSWQVKAKRPGQAVRTLATVPSTSSVTEVALNDDATWAAWGTVPFASPYQGSNTQTIHVQNLTGTAPAKALTGQQDGDAFVDIVFLPTPVNAGSVSHLVTARVIGAYGGVGRVFYNPDTAAATYPTLPDSANTLNGWGMEPENLPVPDPAGDEVAVYGGNTSNEAPNGQWIYHLDSGALTPNSAIADYVGTPGNPVDPSRVADAAVLSASPDGTRIAHYAPQPDNSLHTVITDADGFSNVRDYGAIGVNGPVPTWYDNNHIWTAASSYNDTPAGGWEGTWDDYQRALYNLSTAKREWVSPDSGRVTSDGARAPWWGYTMNAL